MNRSLAQWKQRCVRPALERTGWQMRRGEVAKLPSLSLFSQYHLDLRFCPGFIHAVRSCPMFLHWRNVWSRRLQCLEHAVDHFFLVGLFRLQDNVTRPELRWSNGPAKQNVTCPVAKMRPCKTNLMYAHP